MPRLCHNTMEELSVLTPLIPQKPGQEHHFGQQHTQNGTLHQSVSLCGSLKASRRHNNVQHKTVLPIVTLSTLHASEDIMHMQVRARVYAQGIGITAFMLHTHAK